MRRLARLLASLVLALAVFQAVGSRLPGVRVVCLETCPDDDDRGQCPPACDCTCRAPHQVSLPAPVVSPARPEAAVRYVAWTPVPPQAPDPRALLHVPRSLLG
jgi:hypothetical protein